jgi:hypothetical protein
MIRILSESTEAFVINYESNVFRDNWIDFKSIENWIKQKTKLNKKLFIEKTPSHVRHLGKIFYVFPKARVLVLVRDGRDVVLSLEKRTGNLQGSIERWITDNELWINDYSSDSRVKCVKLEDFIENPNSTLREICFHAGMQFNEEFLKYADKEYTYQNQGIQKSDGTDAEHQLNRNWQVNQPIFEDTNRWKKELTESKNDLLFSNEKFKLLMRTFNYMKML